MFAKRLLQKVTNSSPPCSPQHKLEHGSGTQTELDPRIALHYGIPLTASILAFDPIQRLLAIGTLDGRIKMIGGDNIEGLLMSPKQLPYKNLEFLYNQGFLVSISNENDIQVWDLEDRLLVCSLQWESNITAFSVIHGTYFMYVGDEYGLLSVLKYDAASGKILEFPYQIPANSVTEEAGVSVMNHTSIVGVLPQPCTSGNRVLIVYEGGLIILWDVSEARVVLVRGNNDLQLRDLGVVDSSSGVINELSNDISDHDHEEKEVSSLCWASSSGSILAVGYVDGDIMLWNMSTSSSTKGQQAGISSNNVVKLQLSSSKKRIPVIVLHWTANISHNDHSGQLFIYGGDEIGSEEVLTVLTLEWSSGIETLRCVSRVDLTLNGSFADMILIPNAGETENNPNATLFILTNPGQLHVYDDAILSALSTHHGKRSSVPAMQFPVVIPTVDPYMTVAKLSLVPLCGNSSKPLLEWIVSDRKIGATPTLPAGAKWPLTGGVLSQLSFTEGNGVERIYIAGYQDGSVRMWDATYPVISLMFVLEGEVQNIEVAGASASVSALDFCSLTTSLAVGNECGLVRVYKFNGSSNETSFHFVTDTKREVHNTQQGKGFQCNAVFTVLNSPIRTLQYANSGAKLAVGFECGRVAMLDMSSYSILFLTDCVSGLSSPVISMIGMTFTDIHFLTNSLKPQGSSSQKDSVDATFILTRDSQIVIVDNVTGNMIGSQTVHLKKESTAINMYIIEGSILVSEVLVENHPEKLTPHNATHNEPGKNHALGGVKPQELELHSSREVTTSGERSSESLVLLCCEDALHLFSLKSVLEGDINSIRTVNLVKPCCYTAAFKKKDEKTCGLVLLYQTGVIEVRSLPDFEVVGESSLMSILRWNFKVNMDKTISSSDNGQIALVNGCELAFISLLACENDFRIPDSLPRLHDKALAASADAAINLSSTQKKKQDTAPGILGGIIKGFKGEKAGHTVDPIGSIPKSNFTCHLESIFSKDPFLDSSETIANDEVVELNIDDIEIDGPVHVSSTSSHRGKNDGRDKGTEREKLFQGSTVDTKPRLRTPEEIMAKYRKTQDVSAVAAQAKDKLVQRQEKLERLSRRTEELQSGAENFASMASELAKTMENRKWWNI